MLKLLQALHLLLCAYLLVWLPELIVGQDNNHNVVDAPVNIPVDQSDTVEEPVRDFEGDDEQKEDIKVQVSYLSLSLSHTHTHIYTHTHTHRYCDMYTCTCR